MLERSFKYALLSVFVSSSLYAYSLQESVEKVLANNPEIIADKHNQKAFKKYIDERVAKYYPRIDVDARIERSNSRKDYRNETLTLRDGLQKEDGYNVGIALNQMLYDGNLTPNQIKEAKHNDLANTYRILNSKEEVVSEAVKSYLGLLQYKERLSLTESMINIHENNLQTAKEKEDISGEVLETFQVDSKLNYTKEKYLEEKDFLSTNMDTFKRYIGVQPEGNECRPELDSSKISTNLQDVIEIAVLKNNEILRQIETIKSRRAKIAQADAEFLPNLSLELKAVRDSDLSLNENGLEKQYYGRVKLEWNLFNGGGDYAVSKQEELFLAEQKHRLDAITNKVIETVKINHQRFMKNKKRIDILKKYVVSNENIVKVYKSEFEAGTRTFVDILNAELDLYEAKQSLLNREYSLYSDYYALLKSMSMLTQTVSSSSQNCSSHVKNTPLVDSMVKKDSKDNLDVASELNSLLGDDTEESNNIEDTVVVAEESRFNEPKSSKIVSNNKSYGSFLNAPNGYYTLNITTTKGKRAADSFVKDNRLGSNAYTYSFGPGMKSAKVIYGTYSSIKEAKKAMSTLPHSVLSHRPYIDNISKHKKLYAKYH